MEKIENNLNDKIEKRIIEKIKGEIEKINNKINNINNNNKNNNKNNGNNNINNNNDNNNDNKDKITENKSKEIALNYIKKSILLSSLALYRKAIESTEIAIDLDPINNNNSSDLFHLKAIFYEKLKKFEKAIKAIDQAIQQMKNFISLKEKYFLIKKNMKKRSNILISLFKSTQKNLPLIYLKQFPYFTKKTTLVQFLFSKTIFYFHYQEDVFLFFIIEEMEIILQLSEDIKKRLIVIQMVLKSILLIILFIMEKELFYWII